MKTPDHHTSKLGSKDFVFQANKWPFSITCNPLLATITESLIDLSLIKDMKVAMKKVECRTISYGGLQTKVVGSISQTVQIVYKAWLVALRTSRPRSSGISPICTVQTASQARNCTKFSQEIVCHQTVLVFRQLQRLQNQQSMIKQSQVKDLMMMTQYLIPKIRLEEHQPLEHEGEEETACGTAVLYTRTLVCIHSYTC